MEELRATPEQVPEAIPKRLKALGKRLIYSNAFKHVGHPDRMAAYDLLHGPQDWENMARVGASCRPSIRNAAMNWSCKTLTAT